MSRELPILFNTEMVRAILDGRKSCTRRIIKPQPQSRLCYTFAGGNCGTWGYPSKTAHESWGDGYRLPDGITDEELQRRWNPPYHTDDILYVRETFGYPISLNSDRQYVYRADEVAENGFKNDSHIWHPSIHMPKEAARIWLKVTDVRVEQLQDIDGKGCVKEGIEEEPLKYVGDEFVKGMFHDLWDSTIKKSDLDRYGWDANPWVFVYEFERCKKPKGV